MTDLACLDGRQVAAISDRLAAVYRAAMGAEPFHETEVETGFFTEELAGELDEAGFRCWVASEDDQVVGFAYGYETPDIPPDGWYGLVREAVGRPTSPTTGWPASSRSSGSPSARTGGEGGWAGSCWGASWPAPGPSGPG